MPILIFSNVIIYGVRGTKMRNWHHYITINPKAAPHTAIRNLSYPLKFSFNGNNLPLPLFFVYFFLFVLCWDLHLTDASSSCEKCNI